MKRLIPILLIFASCQSEEIAPTCDWIQSERIGSKVSITIDLDAPSVTMWRDLGGHESSLIIDSAYFECIRIEAERGDVIRFETESESCQITIE